MSNSLYVMTSSYFKPLVSSLTNVSDFIVDLVGYIQTRIRGRETLVGFALIAFGTHAYYWHKHSFWSRRNVKTPRALPLFGNFYSFLIHPPQKLEVEWPKKYGKVYGIYMGTKPYLVCADAQILKKICIRDFDKFPNRYFVGVKNKYQEHFLTMIKDNHWRSMRALLTPTFASGKIKVMSKIMDGCADELVSIYRDEIDKGNGEAIVDLKNLFTTLSIDASVESFFGISLTREKSIDGVNSGNDNSNTKENFARKLRLAFNRPTVNFILTFLLPHRILSFFNVALIKESQMEFFANKAKKMVEHRRKTPSKQNDYLQSLLNVELDSKLELAESDQQEEHHALLGLDKSASDANGQSWRPSKMKLTEMEIVSQTIMMMMVASETSSTLLSHATYLLAYHPDVQERLYQELTKIKGTKEADDVGRSTFDYEQLTSCVYLDCVVSETLRLMPPAINLDRVSSEDYYIEEYDIHVPKGTVVNLAFLAIQRDPDYWPEPEKFNPDRFLPENKVNIVPGSYCPFGIGPRSCIGFRFALTEAKATLAKLVSEFKFTPAPGTKYPPDQKKITFILNVNKNLFASVKRRT